MQKKQNSFSSLELISPIILTLYLCIGFIPNLGAVDKIAPQWFVMTILNLISLFIFFYHRNILNKLISPIVYSSMSLTYIVFIIWAGLSFFYSINPVEVVVNITRQVNVLIMFLSMGIFFYEMKQKSLFFSWIITIILAIETYFVLDQLLELLNTTGNISKRASLKGVAANPNITAFSIVNKLPFVIYLLLKSKRKLFKIVFTVLITGSLICLSAIQSRASFLAVGLIYFLSFFALFFDSDKKLKKRILSGLYILLPLVFSIVINQTFLSNKGADFIKRASSIGLTNSDKSISARLRYYSHVIEQIKETPFLGVGLGNWKFKSIMFDANDIEGYIVPYHAHSDFIQLGAELGIIGFILYLGIFLWAIYYVYLLIRHSDYTLEEKLFLFLLLAGLGSYFIDANLNFPIARPQVLVIWAGIMSLIMVYFQRYKAKKNKFKSSKRTSLLFVLIGVIILIPSLIITNSVFKSLKGQMSLLQDFNSNNYNVSLNQLDNIVPDIPNVTVTTIPINSVKARYYVNAKKYDKALELLNKGTNANPYLYYSEILKSQIFQEQGKLDSAKVYARKAFFGLPNNDLHASRYVNLINITKDKYAIEEAFELLTFKNKLVNWKNYLIIANSINNPKDPLLIERAKKAVEIFPNSSEIKNLYNQISVGTQKLNESILYSNTGLEYFNKGDYQNAAIQFEKALNANPLDYANFENAATANYMIGNLEKAIEQIDVVINDLNPLNGKCEYIKALIFIKMGDPIGACPLLETSRDSGFNQAEATFDQYCR